MVSKEKTEELTIPVIGGGGPSGFTSETLAEKGVLITGRVGTLGKLHVAADDCWPSDNALILRPSSSDFDNQFLRYALSEVISDAVGLNRGAANPLLTQTDLGQLEISAPNLAEQHEIAAVLGSLDDKIEVNRKTAAVLEEMARALYRSWFVDFDPVHAKAAGRAPAHMDAQTAALFPDSFGEDGLPLGWESGILKVLASSIRNGGTPKRSVEEYWKGGTIPWLGSGEVRQSLIASTNSFITEAGLAGSSAKWVEKGAILVALYGATAGQVSRTAIRLTTNQAVCAVSAKENFQNYLYFVLKEQVESLADKAVGSAQQNISKKIVEELPTALPTEDIATAFQKVSGPLFSRLETCWAENQTLATLRDTLLPRLMSGELRVGEAKEQVEAVA